MLCISGRTHCIINRHCFVFRACAVGAVSAHFVGIFHSEIAVRPSNRDGGLKIVVAGDGTSGEELCLAVRVGVDAEFTARRWSRGTWLPRWLINGAVARRRDADVREPHIRLMPCCVTELPPMLLLT